MMKDKVGRVNELLELIHKYDHAYFNEAKPLISDEEYDKLYFKLQELLEDKEVIKAIGKKDMPLATQNSYLDKVKHLTKVLSLDKIKIDSPKFQNQLKNFVKKYDTGQGWVIESKEDGLTIMNYKSKNSATFATRGQSDLGENVTSQLKFDKELQSAVEQTPETMIIRGEGLINNSHFEAIVTQQEQAIQSAFEKLSAFLSADEQRQFELYQTGEVTKTELNQIKANLTKDEAKLVTAYMNAIENKYVSARNLASASLRTKDETMSEQNGVKFVAYDIINSFKFDVKTEVECLQHLQSLGYKVVKYEHVSTEQLFDFFKNEEMAEIWRDCEIYPIDGLVVKPNAKTEHPEYTGHHQKNQIAIKFAPATADSILRAVEWTVGNEGRLTPVALFDTVTITGSNISKASLASWDKIQTLGLKIGDHIRVAKANDVIPDIKKVYTERRTGDEVDIPMPENAEFGLTSDGKVGKVLYSTVYQMPLEDKLDKFAKVLKINSAKKTTFKKFIDESFITDFYDLFTLVNKKDQLVHIDGLGEKTITKLLDEIEASKTKSFEQVILALSIANLGKNATQELKKQFASIDEFLKLRDNFDLLDTANLNYLSVNAIKSLLQSDTIEKLKEIGYFA